MPEFRFAFNVFGVHSPEDFAATCRRAEQHGYDTVFAGDHLGMPSPFPTLVAAAQATERLRVGTLVLNAPFWNPALLAREIATTDVLTGGRLEVGLGSGHMKWEFDEAGIEWRPFGERADQLERLVDQLAEQFAAGGYDQQATLRERFGIPVLRPVQRTGFGGYGPPLIVGGTGERVLRIAARTADVIGIAGGFQVPGQPPGTLRLGTAEEADERVRFAREQAGDRADRVEFQALVQAVVVTDDRRAAAEKYLAGAGSTMTVDELLETPFVLLGTVEEMAEQVLRDHERYGFTYYAVHGPFMDAFAPVIERVRATSGS
ncbi:LLM class F420-dependent oxidoreductase [Saccharopolyspora hordei]|uniref:Putative F420-dependent oxidoreductase n=1 Tax=Saccharopolyspora hordei TaxID=1838 RepID=A0A853AIY4_9PSEU|nr:LLM class F420-dependent oxidoreductase [Saccharopolyspora hordei]NYI84614.1 putative F420-dependent oxidoreductase [Saccharopolyspora hordei]